MPRSRFWIGASTWTKSWNSALEVLGGDADAGVGDREGHAIAVVQRGRDAHFAVAA